MVLELISADFLERRPLAALVLGFFYTFVGCLTAYIFLRGSLSIATLMFVTLLLAPSLINLLSVEEERERKEGLKHFFHNHGDVFEVYLFYSLGVFIAYLVLVFMSGATGLDSSQVISEQMKIVGKGLSVSQIQNFAVDKYLHMFGIFGANVGVAVLFFLLSFFYGAGSIFLMIWNASIFSTFVTVAIQNISKGLQHTFGLMAAFSIYILPEIAGFLVAAIAGGVVSKAVITEKFGSQGFRNVFRDAAVLFLIALGLLLVAAFFESFVATEIVRSLAI
jgi:uncharacterized membrane protein SpoIIM required for sporulation